MSRHRAIREFAASYEDAWNSGDPERVAARHALAGPIVINRGMPWQGCTKIAEMAAGIHADVNRMRVILDDLRIARPFGDRPPA